MKETTNDSEVVSTTEKRKRSFLLHSSEEDLLGRHCCTQDALRKVQREKGFLRKRGISDELDIFQRFSKNLPDGGETVQVEVSEMPNILSNLFSNDLQRVSIAVISLKTLLSGTELESLLPDIDERIKLRLISLLDASDFPALQFEVVCCLSTLAMGRKKFINFLVDNDAVPKLIALMASSYDLLKSQAILGISLIAGEDISFRDLVLTLGVIPHLMDIVNLSSNKELIHNCALLLRSLTKGSSPSDFDKLSPLIFLLLKLISEQQEIRPLSDSCWSLLNIPDTNGNRNEKIVKSGQVPTLMRLLTGEISVKEPALRLITSLLLGTESHMQSALQCGALPALLILLDEPQAKIKKEVILAISSIADKGIQQIKLLTEGGIIKKICQLALREMFDVRRECIKALGCAIRKGSEEQLKKFVADEAINALVFMLSTEDPQALFIALEGLEQLLQRSEEFIDGSYYSCVVQRIEWLGGLHQLHRLQHYSNPEISAVAVRMLEANYEAPDINM